MQAPPSRHIPVLLEETLRWLDPRPGQVLVDGTLGGGGHSAAFVERLTPGGRLIGLDRDPAAVRAAKIRFSGLPVETFWASFVSLGEALAQVEIDRVDGVLLDLGMSSDQLADAERGFSFDSDGPLDLRFDASEGTPAWEWLAHSSEAELADIFHRYGEERYSRRIARRIVAQRATAPIRIAAELASLTRSLVPRSRDRDRVDPATRVFQALRIAVNQELESLEQALADLPDRLKPGGRLAIISFHSLEDRRVKEAFRDDPRLEPLTRKPIRPSETELAANPRSRSAKLRVAARKPLVGIRPDGNPPDPPRTPRPSASR